MDSALPNQDGAEEDGTSHILNHSARQGVLAEHDGRITAVRQENQLAMTFHPELGTDCRIAEYFIKEML